MARAAKLERPDLGLQPGASSLNQSSNSIGLYSVLLGALCLASQNIILRVIFVPSQLFGTIDLGGWLEPSLGSAIFLLWFRTLLMAVLLLAIAYRLYHAVFSELFQLRHHRVLAGWVILSGLLLAVSLSLLNLSISKMEAGIAIGVFFTHSAWTAILTWLVWGDRPTRLTFFIMGMIIIGVLLTTISPSPSTVTVSFIGSLAAISAAWIYAAYNVMAQLCLRPQSVQSKQQRIHPITFSLVSFWIVVITTSPSLHYHPMGTLSPSAIELFLTAGFATAFISLLAYVLLNVGVSRIGAALTSLISSLTPVLTALFAWITLNETLHKQQFLGITLVAVGIAALSVSMRRAP
ncbi:MAG: DMT family transporter [Cyanobacteria bacterium J06627_8]